MYSMWDAPSDRDYYDQPWDELEPEREVDPYEPTDEQAEREAPPQC